MNKYIEIENKLLSEPSIWMVTGCAGFIGSHLTNRLLKLNQKVIGIDNLATGKRENLELLKEDLNSEQVNSFKFFEIDICNLEKLKPHFEGVEYILHQAAIGSVPRSIKEPLCSHQSNVDGFCNLLVLAKDSKKLKKIVFASSSSVYGDDNSEEKIEDRVGSVLSPYALTKKTNELYADLFARVYDLKIVGLRYFNVFGPRQDPSGQYAAVIPRWISAVKNNSEITIYGDGTTSRDFCYIENVIQANLLAATSILEKNYEVFNIALNGSTSLNELAKIIVSSSSMENFPIKYEKFREGDIYRSCANIEKAKKLLRFEPSVFIEEGLRETIKLFFFEKM